MHSSPRKAGSCRSAKTLRLASYNVRKAVGLDRRRIPSRTLDVVASMGADIVALQEADKRLGARPTPFDIGEIQERTGLLPIPLGGNTASLGWHGNALLLRQEITVLDLKLLNLPGLEPRGAIIAHLEHEHRQLTVVATHLGLTKQSRVKQCEMISSALVGFGHKHSIIMGDFNEWRSIGGLSPLTLKHQLLSPGRSFHTSRPIAALDRFALGHGITVLDAGVKKDCLSKKASDHLPIWADIRIEQHL